MEERLVAKRLINVGIIFCIITVFTAALCFKEGTWVDYSLCLFVLDLIFFVLFLFMLENGRAQKQISRNRQTDYWRIVIGILSASAVAFGGSFFPEFVKPVLLIVILMSAFAPRGIALAYSIFLCAQMALIGGYSSYELVAYFLMILFGSMIAEAGADEKLQIWYDMLLFLLSTLMPALAYYYSYQEFDYGVMIWGGIEGLGIVIFMLLCYGKLTLFKEQEIEQILENMLDEEYALAKELKKFSKKEYAHAKHVSKVAKKCAALVQADEQVCAAAAFYYRIGIIEGDQIAENGTEIAIRNCFPEKVTWIIHEYNGVLEAPSTIESAIVQMVDALLKKLEVFDKTTMSSNWNQDMVIYQTLNEFSAQGMYDKSGLSMNMFLKIREYLVNEEALL